MLRIGIDGRAFSSPAGGVRRYVTGLTRALLALDEPLEIVALGGDAAVLPPGISQTREPWHPPTNLGWMFVGLPVAAARAGVDVLHAPAYTAPLRAGMPVVLTIHDVSYERHPEWFPYRRDRIRRTFYRLSARSATRILTDSDFSAAEIVAAYGTPRERITVTPLGVDPSFSPETFDRSPVPSAGVPAPFLLHVGDLHERRNVGTIIEALAELRGSPAGAPGLTLVLAGVDRGLGQRLTSLAGQLDVGEAVVQLGPIDEARLHQLYREATALVYPSLYEGFGLPVLEAMASGTPVIASRAASMPEVLGDAGLLVPPLDVAAWADAIRRVANDIELHARLREAGRRRAAEFTWARTARATLAVYRQAVEAAARG